MNKVEFYKLISKTCCKDVDDKTNLFDLGLSSLTIIKLVNEINTRYNSNINFKDVVNADTAFNLFKIAQGNIKKKRCVNKDENNTTLSSLQKAYIFGRQKDLPLGGISPHVYFEYDTNMKVNTLKNRLKKVLKENVILRSTFNNQGKIFVQENYNIDKIVHTNRSYGNLESYRRKHEHWNFDITRWPLFRFEYFEKANNIYHVCFDTDLLIIDVKSIFTLFKQLYSSEYVKSSISKSNFLPSNEDVAFWNDFHCDTPIPDICDAKEYKQIESPSFKNKHFEISLHELEDVINKCKQYHIRLSVYLLYCYANVLASWNSNKECVINLTTFNENYSDAINDTTKLALVKATRGLKSFNCKELNKFQDQVLDAIEHSKRMKSLDVLKKGLGSDNLVQAPIVFTSYLQRVNTAIDKEHFIRNISHLRTQTPQIFLDCQMYIIDEKLNVNWDYVSEIFDEESISGMFDEFIYKIKSGFNNYNKIYLNSPDMVNPKKHEKTLLQDFSYLSEKYGKKTAIIDRLHTIKYKDLYTLVSRMATFLKTKYNVQHGDRVVVICSKNIESVMTILTIVYLGATYIPVDADIPNERLNEIINEAKPKLVFNPDNINFNNIKNYDKSVMDVKADDNAYIIYTSGSTGKPKGVVVSNSAAVNTIDGVIKKLKLTSNDVLLNVASFSFDLSVFDIFGSMMLGATLILNNNSRDVEEIANLIDKYKVSFWNSVPLEMEMFLEFQDKNKASYSSVKNIILSGDIIPTSLPLKISKLFNNAKIFSFGGATEAGIWSVYYEIKNLFVGKKYNSIPYGKSLPYQQIYVLDNSMNECPTGKLGEIYIGGNSLAKGYYENTKKTNENFITTEGLGRVYKTGDLGEYSKNKIVLFKGRKDRQVKINGFRVELQEIENRLLQISSVTKAIVLDIDNKLVSFCVLQSDLNSKDIIDRLANYLPQYMIPKHYVFLDDVPQTKNGKIDYKSLEKLFKNEETEKNTDKINGFIDSEDNVENWIQNIICKKLNTNVACDESFLELGGDSIVLIQIFNEIKKKYPNLKLVDLFENPTISRLAKFIKNKEE